MAGVSFKDNFEAQRKAIEASGKYQNISQTEALKLANDLRGVLGTQGAANEHLEPLIRSGAFLRAMQGSEAGGHNSESLNRELLAAIKSAEISGKITGPEMQAHINQLTAMKLAFGDQVKITDYLKAQRAAGAALRMSSDKFRYGMFPAMVQEFGPGAGTMLMTAWNKVVAGVTNRQYALQNAYELGLIKKDQLEFDKKGKVARFKPGGGMVNDIGAAINFGDWVMSTLKPMLDKKTAQFADPQMRMLKEMKILGGMFPDRKALMQVVEILQQYKKFEKDAALMASAYNVLSGWGTLRDRFITGAMGKGRVAAYLDGSWDYQKQAFGARWNDLMRTVGAASLGDATKALTSVNSLLASLTKFAEANPAVMESLAAGIATLGVAFAGAGATAIIAALGPAGWLVLGIGTLAAVLEASKPVFDWLEEKGSRIGKSIGDWFGGRADYDQLDKMRAAGMEPTKDSVRQAQVTEFLRRRQMRALGQSPEAAARLAIQRTASIFDIELSKLPGEVQAGINKAISGIAAEINAGLARLGSQIAVPGFGGISNKGGGVTGGAVQKARWESRSGGSVIQVHNVINMDGKKVAESTAKHIANNMRHPRRAPYFDGTKSWTPGDSQFITT
jgi:hypothetical protein